jgi:hypothetical protein
VAYDSVSDSVYLSSSVMQCDATVSQCAAVRQYERQCVAVVRTVDSVRLVHAAVCGSVLGSVWQCARHCTAARHSSSVRQGGGVRQCGSACVAVRQCGSMNGSVWQCTQLCAAVRTVVCGSAYCSDVQQCAQLCLAVQAAVYGSVWQCAAVRQCVAGVRTAVCARCARYGVNSPLGSVWQCAQPCAAVCGSARGCEHTAAVRAVVYGSVQQCAAVRAAVCGSGYARQCAAVDGSIQAVDLWQIVAVCGAVCGGSARGSVWQCGR